VEIKPTGTLHRQLRTAFNLGAIGDLTDGQLLERFATRRDEAAELAFAALVERHGRMVLRVCRHAAGDVHDAEDSFQATFLILVKQARSLWVQDSLGPWLHRVAHRVATRARLSGARLRDHERRAAAARPAVAREQGAGDDLAALLHEEVDRLPERYRVPIVLCDLQGVTHEKAARHLGWPVGTVKTRLARGRELLRGRLTRRGVGPPAGLMLPEKLLNGALSLRAGEFVLPGTLVESTVRAATLVAAGKPLAIGVISSRVAILISEVLKTMVVTKLKLASVVVLIGTAGAAAVLAQQGNRSDSNRARDRPQSQAPAETRQPARGDSGKASMVAPSYIRQSRSLIITRLEEEAAEAQARLDRTLKKFQSPDHPAVIRARETLDALVQRLDKIDRVLVDVVETYPTMVDFSGGPGGANANSQSGNKAASNTELAIEGLQLGGSGGSSADSQNTSEQQDRDRRANFQLRLDRTRYFGNNDSNPEQKGQDLQDGSQKNESNPGKNGQPQQNDSRNDSGAKRQNSRDPSADSQSDSKNNSGAKGQNKRDPSADSQNDSGATRPREQGSLRNRDTGPVIQSNSKSGAQGHGSGIVTADLDGDGALDIIVANGALDGTKDKPQSGQSKSGSDQNASNKSPQGQSKSGSDQNASNKSPQGQSKSDSDQNASNKSPQGQSKDGSDQNASNKSPQGQSKDGSSWKAPNSQSVNGQSENGSKQKESNSQSGNGQSEGGSKQKESNSQSGNGQSENGSKQKESNSQSGKRQSENGSKQKESNSQSAKGQSEGGSKQKESNSQSAKGQSEGGSKQKESNSQSAKGQSKDGSN
jgi:RNA polymerase sigma factor (sigma-70 family)